jgi:toxin ParE1/3/4
MRSGTTSRATASRIGRRFDLLADNPGMGLARDDLRPGLRRFTHARYLIYYRPIRGGIEVVRLVHGARDERAVWR